MKQAEAFLQQKEQELQHQRQIQQQQEQDQEHEHVEQKVADDFHRACERLPNQDQRNLFAKRMELFFTHNVEKGKGTIAVNHRGNIGALMWCM